MTTLLLKNADVLVTMDAERREIPGGGVFIRDGIIEAVGPSADLPETADKVVSLAGCVALPGLVNTHHHMYQTLTRAIPGAQDAELFTWLRTLYPIWAGITPEMIRVSTLTAMAELILSGCTTSSDHLYLYPNGARLDDSIEAAATIGMRFHAARGSMSVGESQGGLPPDRLVENEAAILKDTQRLIETWHDPARHAMLRIVVAPCSPFSVSRDLMREAARLARQYKVSLHTHLAENDNDVAYSREKFGMTPAEYAESLGWVGPTCGTPTASSSTPPGSISSPAPAPASPIAPVRTCVWPRASRRSRPCAKRTFRSVSAVDGSASNDSGHLLGETRQAMLLARVGHGPAAMSARQALELATLGGAKVLGRDDIGALAPGMSADVVAFQTGGLDLAGAAVHDPVASLIFCTPQNVRHSIINGKPVVSDGILLPVELQPLIAQHNRLARELVDR
jgi:8-oxoguanine deaminase